MKSPEEYADTLVEIHLEQTTGDLDSANQYSAQASALVTVVNIIDALKDYKIKYGVGNPEIEYYQEVKNLLEKR